MLKTLVKSFGVLSIVILTSTSVVGQTNNFGIKNSNRDCTIDYSISYGAECTGTFTTITGSCAAGNTVYETVPSSAEVINVVITDPTSLNTGTVSSSGCGGASTTDTYSNCDSNTSTVDYDVSNEEVIVSE